MTTLTQEAIEQRLVDAIVAMGPDPEQVTRSATWEELDIDSLDLVELAQIAEEEFGVALRTEDVKELKTVGEVVDRVRSLTS